MSTRGRKEGIKKERKSMDRPGWKERYPIAFDSEEDVYL
jgi:hypothetical protein